MNIEISSLLHNPTVIKDKCGKNAQLISDESESKVFALVETQDNPFWFESKTVAHIGRSYCSLEAFQLGSSCSPQKSSLEEVSLWKYQFVRAKPQRWPQ
jgi:hypothetical protein